MKIARCKVTVLLLMACGLCLNLKAKGHFPYQNEKLPTAQRVTDLLRRMTLDEKIGQLRCMLAWDYYIRNRQQIELSSKIKYILLTPSRKTLQKVKSVCYGPLSALILGQRRA